MDILNFISWIKGGRVVKTVDPAKTLIPVGLKDARRDDDYLAGAISVEDLAAQIAPSSTYKVYTALLTQTGTDAPVATVLENTLGVNISYSYAILGTYHINSDQNIFLENNVVVLTGAGNVNFYPSLWIAYNGPAQLFITSYNMLTLPVSFTPQDGLLYEQFIEIRVYN